MGAEPREAHSARPPADCGARPRTCSCCCYYSSSSPIFYHQTTTTTTTSASNAPNQTSSGQVMIGRKTRRRRRGRRWPEVAGGLGSERGERGARVAAAESINEIASSGGGARQRTRRRRRPAPLASAPLCLFARLLLLAGGACLAAALFTAPARAAEGAHYLGDRRAAAGGAASAHQAANLSALHSAAGRERRAPAAGADLSSAGQAPAEQRANRGHKQRHQRGSGGNDNNTAPSDEPPRRDSPATAAPEIPRLLGKRAPGQQQQQQQQLLATSAATSASWRQQQLAQQQQQHLLSRISEADLLPLSDFTLEQPAFSDIMKMWPPTTAQQLARDVAATSGARGQQRHKQREQHAASFGQRAPSSTGAQGNQQRPAGGLSFFERITFQTRGDSEEPAGWVRNHLNEDFDDSIVTADESFEQDQLPEPPTWVNYLGELGDFIYLLLRQFYEPSASRSPFGGGGANSSSSSSSSRTAVANQLATQRFEAIGDLLDDFYFDQYENNQVLYYGPQLVREGDILELGCYLPLEQPAEWTKSGRLLVAASVGAPSGDPADAQAEGERAASAQQPPVAMYALNAQNNPLRVIKRANFMGAKQNFSLKIFEAQLSDTGNYRCNRLSRKYHKLIVVPAKVSNQQLYLVQQKLLSVVAPSQVSSQLSSQQIQLATLHASMRAAGGAGAARRPVAIQASGGATAEEAPATSRPRARPNQQQQQQQQGQLAAPLLPGYVLIEGQPLVINCNISDEFILRRLRELPHFQLAWYKNGKLLRNSQPGQQAAFYTSSSLARHQAEGASSAPAPPPPPSARAQPSSARIQFAGPNGRQMYITAANYADAGDYLCSWSRLPARQSGANEDELDEQEGGGGAGGGDASSASVQGQPAGGAPLNANPLAAGNLHQLVAPVKLRPFKSAYSVRQHNQLRLVCQVQRGYPAAQMSWYVGNQLVDADFLRQNPDFRVLQLEARASSSKQQFVLRASPPASSQATTTNQQEDSTAGGGEEEPQIVEINPIPAGRQQMQLTANGRGQWIEYRKLSSDKYAIDTQENQMRYLQMKLAQLTGANVVSSSATTSGGGGQEAGAPLAASLLSQASLSVLVVDRLQQQRHTSRYACRATTRANTDEVTTVIRVKELSTVVIRPNSGAATLIPNQPLHFECAQDGPHHAEFKWYKRALPLDETDELNGRQLLEPQSDDSIEIHNERLTLLKPTYDSVGDYVCQALHRDDKREVRTEYATIKVRAQPYIDDFGLTEAVLSHTGKSATVVDGERLELTCRVRDLTVPVNITWVRSERPDDERQMVKLPEVAARSAAEEQQLQQQQQQASAAHLIQTYTSPGSITVERVDNFTKRLVIESVSAEHRGHYACLVDNGVIERSRKTIFIRVKDRIIALWPFLGILAELFILFTIIYVWETQRAQKALNATTTNAKAANKAPGGGGGSSAGQPSGGSKRPASGPTSAFESVPLNR